MDKINNIRIDFEPANEDVLELVLLIGLTNQTDKEKYEIIKPVADKLNFYCDIHSIRCIDDCDFLAIKMKKIHFAYYNKETEMFMMLMKKSSNLHILNIKKKVLTIYIYKKRHNFVVSYFFKLCDRIWLLYIRCKMRIQLYLYVYKQLYSNSQKHNSD